MINMLVGDARTLGADLPDRVFQAIVTSPPYWQLRRYGESPDEIGLEATGDEYIANLVRTFSGMRHALRHDGTLWINVGDAYNAYNANRGPSRGLSAKLDPFRPRAPSGLSDPALPNKALMGLPWRLALAMQSDGWLLRSEIIWSKTSAAPERTKDRPSRMHEHVFLFSRGPRYYFARTPRTNQTVWAVAPGNGGPRGHPARFPDDLAARCLEAAARPGDRVLDPFAGSGTVLRVADRMGMDATGIDLYPTP